MELKPSKIFFYSCLGFVLGVFLASFAEISDNFLLIGFLFSGGFIAFSVKKPVYAAYGIMLAVLVLGMMRQSDAEQIWLQKRQEFLTIAQAKPASLSATITERERTRASTRYTLENISLADGSRWSLLFTGRKVFSVGERVSMSGVKFDISNAAEKFLKRERIAGTVAFPEEITSHGSACESYVVSVACAHYGIREILSRTKESFEDNLRTGLPEPHASYAAGLILGSRSGLPEDVSDSFKKTGLSHIVAVSGYNISIVILAVSTLLGFFMLNRRTVFWASTLFIILFTLLTGASASVVRASCMGFLVILAQKEARMYSAKNAIAFAGAGMLAENPILLHYDLGFLLSFLATLGLLVFYPILKERTFSWQHLNGVKEILLQSIAAQLTVLPVLIGAFGTIPVIFLVSNAAILPMIPPTMLLGFMGGIAGYFGSWVGRIAAFPAHLLLEYQLKVITILARAPYASIEIVSPTIRWFLAAMAIGGVFFLYWKIQTWSGS